MKESAKKPKYLSFLQLIDWPNQYQSANSNTNPVENLFMIKLLHKNYIYYM